MAINKLSKVHKKALEAWRLKSAEISNATSNSKKDDKTTIDKRIARAKKDYKYFAEFYFPHYCKSECADFHIKFANACKADPTFFGIAEWPREHAKSVHVCVIIPLWLKINGALDGMLLASKNERAAIRLLSDVQAEFENNELYIRDYGQQVKQGSWEEGNFTCDDGTFFVAIGRGQTPRGIRNRAKRPNYGVLDDLDDDVTCRNEERVDDLVDWALEAFYGALAIKQSRFVMAGNRIHKKSILAKIVGDVEKGDPKREDIYHSKVCAIENGKPAWHQNYTLAELNKRMNRMGYRRAQKEYFHNPIIEGKTFKNDWIQWGKIPSLHDMEAIIAYKDPSFKASTKNDYKAIRIWGKKGKYLYLIDCFVRQSTIGEAVMWAYDWYEDNVIDNGLVIPFYMEANFVQDMLIDEYENEGEIRGWQLGVIPDNRSKPPKDARIENMTPNYQRGLVIYNQAKKKSKDMQTGLEQLLAFSPGGSSHDDAPDADEGAWYLLQKRTRQSRNKNNRRVGQRQSSADW